jgi:hypothetical protein
LFGNTSLSSGKCVLYCKAIKLNDIHSSGSSND